MQAASEPVGPASADRCENFTTGAAKVPGPRVLVVDDELLIRWALRECLTAAGYRVIEARDASSGLAHLLKGRPKVDLVLLDLRLPDNHGVGLVARVRRLSPDIRIIVMTAHGDPDLASEAVALGAECVVAKPFCVDEMTTLVGRALARQAT